MEDIDPRMLILLPDVPLASNPNAIRLKRALGIDAEFVNLVPEPIEGGILFECFANVERAVSERGGNVVYGWRIWETMPGVLMEAEFHAVWRDSEGVLHEVSPQAFAHIDRVLFLPDQSRTYEGKQVDNVRLALVSDKMVTQFIKKSKLRYRLLNKGDLAYAYGVIGLTPEVRQVTRQLRQIESNIKLKYFLNSKSSG